MGIYDAFITCNSNLVNWFLLCMEKHVQKENFITLKKSVNFTLKTTFSFVSDINFPLKIFCKSRCVTDKKNSNKVNNVFVVPLKLQRNFLLILVLWLRAINVKKIIL